MGGSKKGQILRMAPKLMCLIDCPSQKIWDRVPTCHVVKPILKFLFENFPLSKLGVVKNVSEKALEGLNNVFYRLVAPIKHRYTTSPTYKRSIYKN